MIIFNSFTQNRMLIHRYTFLLCLFHEVGHCFVTNSPLTRHGSLLAKRFSSGAQSRSYIDISRIKDRKDAKKMMMRLNKDILKHDRLYHATGTPAISDAAYDELVGLAESIAVKYPDLRDIVTKFSRVGSSPVASSKTTLVHSRPMLSLENTFDHDGVRKFISTVIEHCKKHHPNMSTVQFVVEPKVDGLSLSVGYLNGELQQVATRGDGHTGEDVTANARHLLDLPLSLASPSSGMVSAVGPPRAVEVRGEVHITTADFELLNKRRPSEEDNQLDPVGTFPKADVTTISAHAASVAEGSKFSNARNTAAGTLRAHNSQLVSDRRLRFVAYDLMIHKDTHHPGMIARNSTLIEACYEVAV